MSFCGGIYERYHFSRGERHKAVSAHKGHEQTAFAHLRQADDLLPVVRSDERGHSGDPHHLYAAGYAAV